MITPMTRYSFIPVNGEQEGFLSSLQQLGLVDITRSVKPVDEGSALLMGRAESFRASSSGWKRWNFPTRDSPWLWKAPFRRLPRPCWSGMKAFRRP